MCRLLLTNGMIGYIPTRKDIINILNNNEVKNKSRINVIKIIVVQRKINYILYNKNV